MTLHAPRIGALHDTENRLRRDWQEFATVWQQTAETWKDQRRREFEDQHLRELPGVLSRCNAEMNEFRETLLRAMHALSDSDPDHDPT